MEIDEKTLQECCEIVYSECAVMNNKGCFRACAQCIKDNNFNFNAFTKIRYDDGKKNADIWAKVRASVVAVLIGDCLPFPDSKVIKMRSAKYYNDDGTPNWEKLNGGADAFTEEQYHEIVAYQKGGWICGYFGTTETTTKTVYRVVCGSFEVKENAERFSKTLKDSYNLDSFIVESEV